MNGHSRAFLLPEVFRLFPESEGVSGGVFEDVLGIGAFVGIRKRVHLMPNLKDHLLQITVTGILSLKK